MKRELYTKNENSRHKNDYFKIKKTPKTPLNRKVLIPVYTFFFRVKNRAMSKHPILLFTKTLKSTPKLENIFFSRDKLQLFLKLAY